MGYLQGTWLSYVDRSYQQIRTQIITNLQSRVPEMTDHTESNIFIKMVSIWAAIAEMLGYYIDNTARESHLDSARLYGSGISHARANDYRVRGRLASNADVILTTSIPVPSNLVIPIGTVVEDNVKEVSFVTVASVTILAGESSATVGVRQSLPVSGVSLGVALGIPSEEIVVGEDITDSTVIVRINGTLWTRVDTFAYSVPTSKHYKETVNKTQQHVIIFGDGISGAMLASGDAINVDYGITKGLDGNTEATDINEVVTTLTLPNNTVLTVTNPQKAVGGSDVESLEQIQRRVPLSVRTLDRAVTDQDWIDIAELCPGVARAGKKFDCSKTIDMYIVPDGGGLANSVLLSAVGEWFRTRKIIGRAVRIFPAGEVRTKLKITVNAQPTYENITLASSIKANLLEFLSYRNQEIQGELYLSDVYEKVETTPGVRNSDVLVMTTIPYARPLSEVEGQLEWTREIKETSSGTNLFKITFLNATTFELVKNNGYLGQFTVGQLVDLPELAFTITENQADGQSWDFYTYGYFGTIILQEPSLPVAYAEDIEIIVKGGL